MAFPVSPVNGQIYNDGTYTYQYNTARRGWTKIAQTLSNVGNVVTQSGNVVSGNSSLTASNVTVGNTSITTSNIVLGNTTIASSNITLGNTVVSTSNVTIGNTTVSAGNVTVGNTVITNANVTVGNTIVGTNSITAPSFSGNVTSGNTSIVPVANGNVAISVAGVSNVVVITNQGANFNGNANVTGNLAAGNLSVTTDISAATLGGSLTTAAQPNITSVGTLSSLTSSGTVAAGNLTTGGVTSTGSLTVTTGNANINSGAKLNVSGNANFANSANVNLGSNANVHISGGINGYVLSTDGLGNLSWIEAGGGGNGVPGGSNTQVQYNNNGAFAGSPNLTYNSVTGNLQLAGNMIANSMVIGAGIYKFSYSNVYFATTSSVTPDQEIISIPTTNLAGVDFTIISTQSSANIRNITKMSAVIIGSSVNYVEFSTLPVNGYIGDFSINYFPGNITADPALVLKLTPQSGDLQSHKMQITTYLV